MTEIAAVRCDDPRRRLARWGCIGAHAANSATPFLPPAGRERQRCRISVVRGAAAAGRMSSGDTCRIKVVCRVRPLNPKEIASGSSFAVDFPGENVVAQGVRTLF